jgi:uncharacterized protein (TIGR02271 family)
MTDKGAERGPDFYDETIMSKPEIMAGARVNLHAERAVVEKRDVRGRLAIIGRRTVTERKMIEVDVSHEELQIRYEIGDGTEMLGLQAETYVVLLHAEEVEIVKHVRVVTEVRVSKKRVVQQKRLDVNLRHETLDVLDAKRM